MTMSGIKVFFRHCPSCGRRFELRLVSRVEISDEEENLTAKESAIAQSERKETVQMLDPETPITLSIPEIQEIKEFRYSYQCKHCGHEWSEKAVQVVREQANSGYTGD